MTFPERGPPLWAPTNEEIDRTLSKARELECRYYKALGFQPRLPGRKGEPIPEVLEYVKEKHRKQKEANRVNRQKPHETPVTPSVPTEASSKREISVIKRIRYVLGLH